VPSWRITSLASASTPGRKSAGTVSSTAVSERPARTAATASAVRSSNRASGGAVDEDIEAV